MVNWKTTISGIITAAAGFVAFSPETFASLPVVVSLAKYIMLGGLLSMGINGKDNDVTGVGQNAQKENK